MSYPPGPPSYPPPQQWGGQPQWGGGGHDWTPPPPPQPPEKPQTLKIAVAAMWAAAALTLLTMPLAFVQKDEIREVVAEDQPTLSESDLDLAVNIGLAGAVFAGLIGITLWVVNAVNCGKGRAWSRILGTVLFGISILTLPFSLTQPASGLSRAVQGVSVLLSIAAVVFLWLPDSNRFFRDSDRVRRGY